MILGLFRKPPREDERGFQHKRYSEVRLVFHDNFRNSQHYLRALLGVSAFQAFEGDLVAWHRDPAVTDRNTTRAAEMLIELSESAISRRLHEYYVDIKAATHLRWVKESYKRPLTDDEAARFHDILERYPEPPDLPLKNCIGTSWGTDATLVWAVIHPGPDQGLDGLHPLLGRPFDLFLIPALLVHQILLVLLGLQWERMREDADGLALLHTLVTSLVLHAVAAALMLKICRGQMYLRERIVPSATARWQEIGLLAHWPLFTACSSCCAGVAVLGCVRWPLFHLVVTRYCFTAYSGTSLTMATVLIILTLVSPRTLTEPWDNCQITVPR